jgi:hypothetical protein
VQIHAEEPAERETRLQVRTYRENLIGIAAEVRKTDTDLRAGTQVLRERLTCREYHDQR